MSNYRQMYIQRLHLIEDEIWRAAQGLRRGSCESMLEHALLAHGLLSRLLLQPRPWVSTDSSPAVSLDGPRQNLCALPSGSGQAESSAPPLTPTTTASTSSSSAGQGSPDGEQPTGDSVLELLQQLEREQSVARLDNSSRSTFPWPEAPL